MEAMSLVKGPDGRMYDRFKNIEFSKERYVRFLNDLSDLKYKAEVFLNYHKGSSKDCFVKDICLEDECVRRFGISLDSFYEKIFYEIFNSNVAFAIFLGEITNEDELVEFRSFYENN